MDSEIQAHENQTPATDGASPQAEPGLTPTPPNMFQTILSGPQGLRAGWSIVFFFAFFTVFSLGFAFGGEFLIRTYLHRTPRDTLIELPLAWYEEKGGSWNMNPGYDTAHPPIARKIGYDCMFCHNASPSIPANHDHAGVEL